MWIWTSGIAVGDNDGYNGGYSPVRWSRCTTDWTVALQWCPTHPCQEYRQAARGGG